MEKIDLSPPKPNEKVDMNLIQDIVKRRCRKNGGIREKDITLLCRESYLAIKELLSGKSLSRKVHQRSDAVIILYFNEQDMKRMERFPQLLPVAIVSPDDKTQFHLWKNEKSVEFRSNFPFPRYITCSVTFSAETGDIMQYCFSLSVPNRQRCTVNSTLICSNFECTNGSDTQKLRKCAACRTYYYCSRQCQLADWPNHKVHCSQLN